MLLVFDEIVTGFGRLGHWFAAEQLEVWPDMLCVGKGLSGGYVPLSAVLLTPRVAEAFWGEADANRQFQSGHTFAGNPVSAACGLAVIDYIRRNDVLDNVRARGAELGERLGALAARSPLVAALRGHGLLYCLDFVLDCGPVGTAVQQAARRRGMLVRASPHNTTLAPPLVITSEEIDEVAGALGRRSRRGRTAGGGERGRRPGGRVRHLMAAAARNGNPRRSLVDAAAETLRRRIAEGDFGPSERLPPERVLTDELGVSRSVLREALSSLEALGLVEARGAAGRFVAAGDPSRSQSIVAAWLHQHARELLEIDEIRSVLEAHAIRSLSDWDALDAARRAAELLRAQEEAVERGDVVAAADADADFHRLLCSYYAERRPTLARRRAGRRLAARCARGLLASRGCAPLNRTARRRRRRAHCRRDRTRRRARPGAHGRRRQTVRRRGSRMSLRVGADTGGTFTDLVLVDEGTGERRMAKVPSTPDDPARAVFAALERRGARRPRSRFSSSGRRSRRTACSSGRAHARCT